MREYLFSDEAGRKVAYFFNTDMEAMDAAAKIPTKNWSGIITIKHVIYLNDGRTRKRTIGWVLPYYKHENTNRFNGGCRLWQ